MAPIVEGVRQDDFASLERTLLGLAQEYCQAGLDGNRARQKECRQLVISAKDHARLATHNPKTDDARRAQKEEMVLWMMTWLENPLVFEMWVPLRKARRRENDRNPMPA